MLTLKDAARQAVVAMDALIWPNPNGSVMFSDIMVARNNLHAAVEEADRRNVEFREQSKRSTEYIRQHLAAIKGDE